MGIREKVALVMFIVCVGAFFTNTGWQQFVFAILTIMFSAVFAFEEDKGE